MMHLTGREIGNFLYRSVKNKFKSTTATRKPGILTATVLQWTGAEPASTIMERLEDGKIEIKMFL